MTKPIQKISPFLWFDNQAEEAAKFYTSIFKNSRVNTITTLTELTLPEGAICEVMAGTPQEIVSRLAQRGFDHLYIDGGVTVQGLLQSGLIQRFIIIRIPVLLVSGIPLFGSLPHDVRLEHLAM